MCRFAAPERVERGDLMKLYRIIYADGHVGSAWPWTDMLRLVADSLRYVPHVARPVRVERVR